MTGSSEYKATFDLVDVDGDGYISTAELRNLMRSLGVDVNATRAVEVMVAADADRDGKISLEEFTVLMERTRG